VPDRQSRHGLQPHGRGPGARGLGLRPLVAAEATFTYTSNKSTHVNDGSTLTFECRLDAGAFTACPATGRRFDGLSDGTHEFAVRAIFRGSVEPQDARHPSATATHRRIVDTTAPDTAITSGPLGGTTIVDVAPTLAFSASEDSTFTCRVDAGPAVPCSSPFTTPPLTAGRTR
jgi:hypothetical protein